MLRETHRMEQLRNDYRATFGTEPGRKVLWDILSACHVFRSSFIPGKPETTFFREGERNVGLRIMNIMNVKTVDDLQQVAEMEP